VGLFASTVALRADLAGDPTFAELVAQVRDVVLWAVGHENAPFEQIVAQLGLERDLSRHPVFQVFVAHVPQAPLPLAGSEPFDARPATSRFDLTLFIEEERDDALELAWEYSTDLFDAATIERFGRHYLRLLEAAMADPALTCGRQPGTFSGGSSRTLAATRFSRSMGAVPGPGPTTQNSSPPQRATTSPLRTVSRSRASLLPAHLASSTSIRRSREVTALPAPQDQRRTSGQAAGTKVLWLGEDLCGLLQVCSSAMRRCWMSASLRLRPGCRGRCCCPG